MSGKKDAIATWKRVAVIGIGIGIGIVIETGNIGSVTTRTTMTMTDTRDEGLGPRGVIGACLAIAIQDAGDMKTKIGAGEMIAIIGIKSVIASATVTVTVRGREIGIGTGATDTGMMTGIARDIRLLVLPGMAGTTGNKRMNMLGSHP